MFFLQFNEVLSSNIKDKNSLNFEIVIIFTDMKLKIIKHRHRTVEMTKFKHQDVSYRLVLIAVVIVFEIPDKNGLLLHCFC